MPEYPWDDAAAEARHERVARTIAPVVALLLAFLIVANPSLRAFFRTFVSMWVHELGHAVAGWLTGFPAVPGPWRTLIPDTRSIPFMLLLSAGLGLLAVRAWRAEQRSLARLLGGVIALQLFLSLALRPAAARTFFTFAGDGGGLVIGALLVASFHVSPDHVLARNWLRWGFLGIGALGFADPFSTWLRARRDSSVIPYGEIEGVGLSDPTKLVDEHGWTQGQMVSRYVALGVVCLLVMVLATVRGVWTAGSGGARSQRWP